MPRTHRDRVIALAGLFQSVSSVRTIAHTGQVDSKNFEVCLGSLLKIDAASNEEVYGGLDNLYSGLKLLNEHLRKPKDMEMTRYIVSLLVLERKLARQPLLLQRIREGIEAALEKLNYFPPTHENIIAHLAEIYSSTVSTLKPRIMVNGKQIYLTRPENANRIRTLLLAGMRAAILWRQSGGKRWTLILNHKTLCQEVQHLLASLENQNMVHR
jgi:high frequency lysogenization protein